MFCVPVSRNSLSFSGIRISKLFPNSKNVFWLHLKQNKTKNFKWLFNAAILCYEYISSISCNSEINSPIIVLHHISRRGLHICLPCLLFCIPYALYMLTVSTWKAALSLSVVISTAEHASTICPSLCWFRFPLEGTLQYWTGNKHVYIGCTFTYTYTFYKKA